MSVEIAVPQPIAGLQLRSVRCELRPDVCGASPPWLMALLRADADAPFQRDERVRTAVRDLLRQHGYRPTGRGKPSSEYLVAAAERGELASIHPIVDLGNAASLHSGLPISVVDLDRTRGPLHVAPAPPGSRYVFNRSGQEIELDGLLCLFDADGPCANAVKDAQRTKTHAGTTRALAIVWGVAGPGGDLADRVATFVGQLAIQFA